jgi:hypothetical protein
MYFLKTLKVWWKDKQMTKHDIESQTQIAIDFAGAFANEDWYNQAEVSVQRLIQRGIFFTTDDVWELLKDSGYTTPEPRALGSVMRQFAKDKQIIPTGSFRKSLRPECHSRPLAVWRPVTYKFVGREAE